MRYVGDDGHVGIDAVGYHFSSTQADFLLHGIHDIEAKGQVFAVFPEHPGHFGNHEAAHAVVQRPAHVELLVHHHELILERDD